MNTIQDASFLEICGFESWGIRNILELETSD